MYGLQKDFNAAVYYSDNIEIYEGSCKVLIFILERAS